MDYFNSFEFWIYLVWVSSAVGFGLCIGVSLFLLIDKLFNQLANLKFKKDKGEEK